MSKTAIWHRWPCQLWRAITLARGDQSGNGWHVSSAFVETFNLTYHSAGYGQRRQSWNFWPEPYGSYIPRTAAQNSNLTRWSVGTFQYLQNDVTRRVLGEIEKFRQFWGHLWPPISRARVNISGGTWAIIFYFLRAFEWRITYGGKPIWTICHWYFK